jgi:hypothetical protein
MPSESTSDIGFPPLDPVVGSLSAKSKFDPKTRFRCWVLALEKRDGIDLGDDFGSIPSGRFVPNGTAATGSRQAVVDASKKFRLQRAPHTEDGGHRELPRALETNTVRDTVSE